MTEFRKVDNLRHRCYRWLCVECNKTFDYAARTYIGAPNARAVSPVYCPECGACDFVRSAKFVRSTKPEATTTDADWSNYDPPTAPDWMTLDDTQPEPEPSDDDFSNSDDILTKERGE